MNEFEIDDSIPIEFLPLFFTASERKPLFDCRHHVANYMEVIWKQLGRLYIGSLQTPVGLPGPNITLNVGDGIAQRMGITEQIIAASFGPQNPTAAVTEIYGLIENEVNKYNPNLGLVVVFILRNLMNNNFLPTFELKRMGKLDNNGNPLVDPNNSQQDGKGLATLLFNRLDDGLISWPDYEAIMNVYRAIEEAVSSFMDLTYDGFDIDILNGVVGKRLALSVNCPISIQFPQTFSNLVPFSYPASGEHLQFEITIPQIRFGNGLSIKLLRNTSDDEDVEEDEVIAEIDLNQPREVRITDLRLRIRAAPIRLTGTNLKGWPTHLFTRGSWENLSVEVLSGDFDIDVQDVHRAIAEVLNIRQFLPPDEVSVAVNSILDFGDDILEWSLKSYIRKKLKKKPDIASLASDEDPLKKIPQSLTQGHFTQILDLGYPLNGTEQVEQISLAEVQVQTQDGALRFFNEQLPEAVIGNPPNITDPPPTIVEVTDPWERGDQGWRPLLSRIAQYLPKVEPLIFAQEAVQNSKFLSTHEKLANLLSLEGFTVEEIVNFNIHSVNIKERSYLGKKLPKSIQRAAQDYFKENNKKAGRNKSGDEKQSKDAGAKKNSKYKLIQPSDFRRSFVRGGHEIFRLLAQKAPFNSPKPRLTSVPSALSGVFICQSSDESPLDGRVGSVDDPAHVELSCNCLGPNRILDLYRRGGHLFLDGRVEQTDFGEIEFSVSEVQKIAVDFGSTTADVASRNFSDLPALAVQNLRGSIRLPGSPTETPFAVTARIRMYPAYLESGCLPDNMITDVWENLSCVNNLTNGSIDQEVHIRELLFRNFVFLASRETASAPTEHTIEIEGATIQIFSLQVAEEVTRPMILATLRAWTEKVFPLPLIFDPWHNLGTQVSEVVCSNGWIKIQKSYLLERLMSSVPE
ncbi:MAG: hypothetical protein AAF429_06960 [Pseudomonadota bacterium]